MRNLITNVRAGLHSAVGNVSAFISRGPAWVAQLDVHPICDQEVADSTFAGLASFFPGEIFSTVILSIPLIQEGQWSVSGKRMCTILVNGLEV